MTDTYQNAGSQSLGVGSIISESFSILGRNFLIILLISFSLTAISTILSGIIFGFGIFSGAGEVTLRNNLSISSSIISLLLQLIANGIMTAMMVHLAYDSRLGRPLQIMKYVSVALAVVVPIAVLALLVSILTGIGFALFVIPGLWIYAIFYVTPAAVVIERVGFGGLGRSASLTKNYRWPIVGLFILFVIMIFLLSLVAQTVGAMISGIVGVWGTWIPAAAINGLGYSLLSISVALTYARLREIKEGTSVDDLASVFD